MSERKTTNSIDESTITIDLKVFALPVSIFISVILGALMISLTLSSGLSNLSEIIKTGAFNAGSNTATAETNSTPQNYTVTASVDDDPFIGNADAPITIVEFAAYDCPFCQRHAEQTLPNLKTEYIDKGLVKYIFRDSPLSGGGQNYQANVANCAKKVGGNSNQVYFQFHDLIYRFFEEFRTPAARETVNAEILKLASSVGLNGESIVSCATNSEFADEINKDQSDLSAIAQSMGLSGLGVPTFIIGRSNSEGTISADVVVYPDTGNIEGGLINGAWPLERFQEEINKLL